MPALVYLPGFFMRERKKYLMEAVPSLGLYSLQWRLILTQRLPPASLTSSSYFPVAPDFSRVLGGCQGWGTWPELNQSRSFTSPATASGPGVGVGPKPAQSEGMCGFSQGGLSRAHALLLWKVEYCRCVRSLKPTAILLR